MNAVDYDKIEFIREKTSCPELQKQFPLHADRKAHAIKLWNEKMKSMAVAGKNKKTVEK